MTETEGQVSRLEKVFEMIEVAPRGKRCEAIEGMIEEGSEIMKEFKGARTWPDLQLALPCRE
jgi:ferritin-like metal-binding protein YciE